MLVQCETPGNAVSTIEKESSLGPWAFDLYPRLFRLSKDLPQPYIYGINHIDMVASFRESSIRIPVRIRDTQEKGIACLHYADTRGQPLNQIKQKVERVLGLELDLKSFYNSISDDSVLALVTRKLSGLRPVVSATPFEGLVRSVVKQVIRAESARLLMSRITTDLGQRIHVDGICAYSFPTPTEMACVQIDRLKALGLGYKASLLKTLSAHIANQELDLVSMMKADEAEIVSSLTQYKGIGSWTARAFAADGLGRLDLYPTKDVNLRKAVSILFHKGRDIAWSDVETIVNRYEEHRGLLIFYLMAYLWLWR